MSNLNVQIKDKSGNVIYPKTLGSLVYNSSNQSLGGVEAGAEVNIIETVKVNGSALTPDANRAINVSVPSYSIIQQAQADSGYVATYYLSNGTLQQGDKIQIPAGGSGSGGIIMAYVVSGATPLSTGWLSETVGGSALTPSTDVLYVVLSSGDYINKLYRYDSTNTVYVEVSAVVLPTATDSVVGGMKLYSTVGTNTDGTMSQSAIKSYVENAISEAIESIFLEQSGTVDIDIVEPIE